MSDTILEGDRPRIISAKCGCDWLNSFRGEDFFKFHLPFFYFQLGGHLGWKSGSPNTIFKDHSTKVWLQLAQCFLRRRLKCEMLRNGRQTKSDGNSSHGLKARRAKNGIYVKLPIAMQLQLKFELYLSSNGQLKKFIFLATAAILNGEWGCHTQF